MVVAVIKRRFAGKIKMYRFRGPGGFLFLRLQVARKVPNSRDHIDESVSYKWALKVIMRWFCRAGFNVRQQQADGKRVTSKKR